MRTHSEHNEGGMEAQENTQRSKQSLLSVTGAGNRLEDGGWAVREHTDHSGDQPIRKVGGGYMFLKRMC